MRAFSIPLAYTVQLLVPFFIAVGLYHLIQDSTGEAEFFKNYPDAKLVIKLGGPIVGYIVMVFVFSKYIWQWQENHEIARERIRTNELISLAKRLGGEYRYATKINIVEKLNNTYIERELTGSNGKATIDFSKENGISISGEISLKDEIVSWISNYVWIDNNMLAFKYTLSLPNGDKHEGIMTLSIAKDNNPVTLTGSTFTIGKWRNGIIKFEKNKVDRS